MKKLFKSFNEAIKLDKGIVLQNKMNFAEEKTQHLIRRALTNEDTMGVDSD